MLEINMKGVCTYMYIIYIQFNIKYFENLNLTNCSKTYYKLLRCYGAICFCNSPVIIAIVFKINIRLNNNVCSMYVKNYATKA
jgi:hypothetical protein